MSRELTIRSKSLLEAFQKSGWPPAVLFTGQQTKSKRNKILEYAISSLYECRYKENRTKEETERMVLDKVHPDFYIFSSDRIKIGEGSKPEEGTIRHLIDHVLPYAPRLGSKRFVYFQDASMINDQAESALLKSLEEPPPNTHFILSVWEPELLKETIVSRTRQIRLEFELSPEDTPNDPWERFWFLSRWQDTDEYDKLKESGWIDLLREKYDYMNFHKGDYEIFEDIAWNRFNEFFSKESKDFQTLALKLTFLPLYFSVRDALIEGKGPSAGPVNLPQYEKRKLLYFARLMEGFFQKLETRYLDTRPPMLNIVVFSFLFSLMEKWQTH